MQRAGARRRRAAPARRRRRSAPAAAARTRASSCPTGPGCRRGPSCARRAARASWAVMKKPPRSSSREELDREPREPVRLLEPAQLAGRDVQLVAGRARRWRSPRGSPGRSRGRSRHVRKSRPSGAESSPSRKSPSRAAASQHSLHSASRRPASASAASASPFQEAIALSSRAGCGRCARSSRSRARSSGVELAADDRAPVLERLRAAPAARPPRGVHVYVSPSTPSVSASCDEAKPPSGSAQLAEHVLDGLLDDLRGSAPRRCTSQRVQVRGDEQRVVVEHLLEVRHEPALVDRVAVEAAADEVVHAARGHRVERRASTMLELAAAQQELERRGGRELRRAAEAAPARVEDRAQARATASREHRARSSGSLDGAQPRSTRGSPSTSCRAARATSSRRSRYASRDRRRAPARKLGSPCRGSGGK